MTRWVRSRDALGLERQELSCCLLEVVIRSCALPRRPVAMRAYLGLMGKEGDETEPVRLIDVVSDRLARGGLCLAVGSKDAGDVQNCSLHEDGAGRMGDEEFR